MFSRVLMYILSLEFAPSGPEYTVLGGRLTGSNGGLRSIFLRHRTFRNLERGEGHAMRSYYFL